MTKINFNDINFSLSYEGYFWYSNATKPEVFLGAILSKEKFTNMPFIIEGNLYCKLTNLSISIKHVDGEYLVHSVILNNLPDRQWEEEDYIAHDLDGISKIRMLQYWEEGEPDELLAGMTTLIPAWQAFKGFIKENN